MLLSHTSFNLYVHVHKYVEQFETKNILMKPMKTGCPYIDLP